MIRFSITLKVLAFASIFFVSQFTFAENFTLKPLRKGQEVHQLLPENHKPTVVMIFQPDCSWCKKQGEVLSKLKVEFGLSMNFSLVGTNGGAQSLKRELKHYDKTMPAYGASIHFLRRIGGFKASPTLLVFNENGELLGKRRGFVKAIKLRNVLMELDQSNRS